MTTLVTKNKSVEIKEGRILYTTLTESKTITFNPLDEKSFVSALMKVINYIELSNAQLTKTNAK